MTVSMKFSGVLALIAIGFAILFFFDPVRTSVYPPCPFHWLTGLNCPGCGSIRALHQLAHGHFAAAFGCNPLTVLMLPVVAYLGVSRRDTPINPILAWVLVGTVVVFGVLRNIPTYPFTLLAP
jgi:hypothetical protein